VAEAVAAIPNGATLMIGGFMAIGTRRRLIDELVRQRKRGPHGDRQCHPAPRPQCAAEVSKDPSVDSAWGLPEDVCPQAGRGILDVA